MAYAINVFLTNGDVFCKEYASEACARVAWGKVRGNPLVVYASLHDELDCEIDATDRVEG